MRGSWQRAWPEARVAQGEVGRDPGASPTSFPDRRGVRLGGSPGRHVCPEQQGAERHRQLRWGGTGGAGLGGKSRESAESVAMWGDHVSRRRSGGCLGQTRFLPWF